jgi:8-oxo-dGTP diphosphatase
MTVVKQAGAIAYRITDGVPLVLVVRAKRHPDHTIFPKGKIKPGETEAAAALRELCEEGGVEAEVVSRIGPSEFEQYGVTLRITYYLCAFVRTVGTEEPREPRWCTVEEALRLLTFPDVRGLLLDAVPIIEGHPRPGASGE